MLEIYCIKSGALFYIPKYKIKGTKKVFFFDYFEKVSNFRNN